MTEKKVIKLLLGLYKNHRLPDKKKSDSICTNQFITIATDKLFGKHHI